MTTPDTTTLCISGWINPTTGETGNCDAAQHAIPNPWWHRIVYWPKRLAYRLKAQREKAARKQAAAEAAEAAEWKYYGTVDGAYVYHGGLFTYGETRIKTQWSIYVNHLRRRARTHDGYELDYNALTRSNKVVRL
jgi:hypothetical protein